MTSGSLPAAIIPAAILPAGAAQSVVRLDDWHWTDPDLERWTRQQFPDALERRRREFAAGRVCAAQVVHSLTGRVIRPHEIARSASGAPAWPPDVVGSLAHSRHLAGAVARRRGEAMGIGLDIEPIMTAARAHTVGRRVGTRDELAGLQQSGALTHAAAVTLTFCAKEALFKCLHPLAGTMFHLSDAQVETAHLHDDGACGTAVKTGRLELRLGVDLSTDIQAGRSFSAAVAIANDVAYAVVSI